MKQFIRILNGDYDDTITTTLKLEFATLLLSNHDHNGDKKKIDELIVTSQKEIFDHDDEILPYEKYDGNDMLEDNDDYHSDLDDDFIHEYKAKKKGMRKRIIKELIWKKVHLIYISIT